MITGRRSAPKDPGLVSRVHAVAVFSAVSLTDDETRLLAKILQAGMNGWPLTAHERGQLEAIEARAKKGSAAA